MATLKTQGSAEDKACFSSTKGFLPRKFQQEVLQIETKVLKATTSLFPTCVTCTAKTPKKSVHNLFFPMRSFHARKCDHGTGIIWVHAFIFSISEMFLEMYTFPKTWKGSLRYKS